MNKKIIMLLSLGIIFIIMLSNCTSAVEEKEYKIDHVANPTEQFFIFVDINNGTNGAAGTRLSPVDDIMEGITLAEAAGKDACVAEGTYNVDSSLDVPTNIVMTEGVSIYGGYQNAGGVWTRNKDVYFSIINDLTTVDRDYLLSTVNCDSGITGATVIDGFTITSGYGSKASAIFCNSGSPTISNNVISGYSGANSGERNYGIYCNSGSPLIKYNVIYGGSMHELTTGIFLSDSLNINISYNEIYGTYQDSIATYYSLGIRCENTNGVIINNQINGGENAGYCCGIYLYISSPLIKNNEIYGGLNSVNSSIGIECINSSNPSIVNNTITGGSGTGSTYGIACGDECDPDITSNRIYGGDSENVACAIQCLFESNPDISNNIIFSGNSDDYKYGILCLYSSNPRIYKNQISAAGDACICIGIMDDSSPEIIQNLLSALSGDYRCGIFEFDDASNPMSVAGNAFDSSLNGGTGSCLYRDYFGGVEHLITTITELNGIDETGYNPAGSVSGNNYTL